MNTITLTLTIVAALCFSLGLIAGLILLIDLYRKLNRLVSDTSAVQRMVVTHGDSQLSADSRLGSIDRHLAKLQLRELQASSLIAALSSVENAEILVEESGVTDAERLAMRSGLTEREANLMIQLRSAYSTDRTSPPEGAK